MLVQLCSRPEFDGTYGAPVAVLLSGKESIVQYETVCAASAQNMLIAAHSLGVASCWSYFPIYAFHLPEGDKWHENLRIPAGHKPCISVLLGYSKDSQNTGEDKRYKNAITYID